VIGRSGDRGNGAMVSLTRSPDHPIAEIANLFHGLNPHFHSSLIYTALILEKWVSLCR